MGDCPRPTTIFIGGGLHRDAVPPGKIVSRLVTKAIRIVGIGLSPDKDHADPISILLSFLSEAMNYNPLDV